MHRLTERLTVRFACPIFCTGDFNCALAEEPGQKLLAYGFRDTRELSTGPRSGSMGYHAYPRIRRRKGNLLRRPDAVKPPELAYDHILLLGEANVLAHATLPTKKPSTPAITARSMWT